MLYCTESQVLFDITHRNKSVEFISTYVTSKLGFSISIFPLGQIVVSFLNNTESP